MRGGGGLRAFTLMMVCARTVKVDRHYLLLFTFNQMQMISWVYMCMYVCIYFVLYFYRFFASILNLINYLNICIWRVL